MFVNFPNIFAIDQVYNKNSIRQIARRCLPTDGTMATFTRGKLNGLLFQPVMRTDDEVLIVPHKKHIIDEDHKVVCAEDATRNTSDLRYGTWIKHPLFKTGNINYVSEIENVVESWKDAFSYIEEDKISGAKGLRNPQIGAIHAAHAHWCQRRRENVPNLAK